jgi:hypothetical protein
MTINSNALTNRRETNAVKARHSVEDIVINALTQVDHARKEQAWSEELEVKQQITRILVKKLFSCASQNDVDRVIVEATKSTESFMYEWGHDVDFHARIRNAELQVRALLEKGYNVSSINPTKVPFPVMSKDCVALVDSWGHMADRLLKGFALKI